MFPQGVDSETAMGGVGLFPEADLEMLPCETLLIVLSVLGVFAAVIVECLDRGWFVASAPSSCSDVRKAPVTSLAPKTNLSEEPPVPKEGLVKGSEVRAVVKNTFLHFEEPGNDDRPSSPLSRSMPIVAFNHALKAELLQQTIQPRSPQIVQPSAVATVIEDEQLGSQVPLESAPVALQHCSRPRKRRTPRSARKKRPNLPTGTEWEPCREPEVFSMLPRTPIAGGGTPRTSTSSATPLCLEVLVPKDAPMFIELESKKVRPRNRSQLSLMHELGHNFQAHEQHAIDPLWGQFLD